MMLSTATPFSLTHETETHQALEQPEAGQCGVSRRMDACVAAKCPEFQDVHIARIRTLRVT